MIDWDEVSVMTEAATIHGDTGPQGILCEGAILFDDASGFASLMPTQGAEIMVELDDPLTSMEEDESCGI